MVRSKILLVGLLLTPAALAVTGYSSLGEAKGDECKAKPDSSAPAGMHWYYRVDRANSRHCWYLHEQGMPVHSLIESTSRHPATRNDVADEQIRETPPVIGTPWPPIAITAEPTNINFGARWVDLPKSVDLNAHAMAMRPNSELKMGEDPCHPLWPVSRPSAATCGRMPDRK